MGKWYMNTKILELISLLNKNAARLDKTVASMNSVYSHDLPKIGKTGTSALMVAGLLENYYTCLETMLFRIAQFFETALDQTQWHKDLLEKMTVSVEGVRIAAVSDDNYPRLLELLKFRQFRRYYFEMEYDWDRLEYLRKKLLEAHPQVLTDISHFTDFLKSI